MCISEAECVQRGQTSNRILGFQGCGALMLEYIGHVFDLYIIITNV